jgi:hypothetical protein
MVTIEITLGKGERQRTLTRVIDPEELPLGTIEDIENIESAVRMSDVLPLLMGVFDLTRAEVREITMKQFKEICASLVAATNEATTVPNA